MRREIAIVRDVETQASAPQYELRVRRRGPTDSEYEVWQVRAASTPHVRTPIRVAGLHGRNLELVEYRLVRRLAGAGIRVSPPRPGEETRYVLPEAMAMNLGLLFRALAPMRSRENMRRVAEGIEAMELEEAAYWLGMAMYRQNPRRVLSSLRVLLTDPRRGPELVR